MLICGIDLAEGKKDSTDTPLLYKKFLACGSQNVNRLFLRS